MPTPRSQTGVYTGPCASSTTVSRRSSASRAQVLSAEVASLVANILSDPGARALEFGRGGPLDLAVQTAVKTGTSSDHRDAWAVGFNHRYTVGVWMGNLDRRAMHGVTGANGPAPVLRSVFAELNRRGETRPLYLSPRLVRAQVCIEPDASAAAGCRPSEEWFLPGTQPSSGSVRLVAQDRLESYGGAQTAGALEPRIRNPSHGLHLAMDPRIPDRRERFMFELAPETARRAVAVEWVLNGVPIEGAMQRHAWPLTRGRHTLVARVTAQVAETQEQTVVLDTDPVSFVVK